MTDAIVARQPILDRKQDLFAYELLFRPAPTELVSSVGGDAATARVLITSLIEMGLDRVVGNAPAFVNLTESLLLQPEVVRLLPRESLVLEILETVCFSPPVVEAIQGYADAGYRLALDDFEFQPAAVPLLAVTEFVKIDVLQLGRDGVRRQLDQLRSVPKLKAKLLAEKVETLDEYQWCMEQGFQYFQGYYFCKPRILEGKTVPTSQMTVLLLIAQLQNPEVSFEEIDRLLKGDVGLAHRVLKIVNSAQYGLRRKLNSIKDALIYLGLRFMRMWASLIALAGMSHGPKEMLVTTLVRARMCELLAESSGKTPVDPYFLVGLLSALDVLLGRPLEELLRELPISEDVRAALLRQEGDMGAALNCALAQERGEWGGVNYGGLPAARIYETWLAALTWAQETGSRLQGE